MLRHAHISIKTVNNCYSNLSKSMSDL